ncbi:MAG: pyruvate dehydrogenase complex dihydrolipoamide acetyltransferase [Gemmatimonadota bacterium]|nr:pyruvate dehydrogenase complex dihydrolipoamide acetyltransferase [Gemmatimonadota bacterium]
MEALSPTMEEGQVVRWLKTEGEVVSNGETIAEIETDKATMEMVARGDGVLRKIFLGEGGTCPVGEVIAVIAGPDEDISGITGAGGGAAPAGAAPAASAAAAPPVAPPASPAAAPQATPSPAATAPAPAAPASDGGRVKASPLARRLATDMGVDIAAVQGSGPGGRIVKRDVEAAKEAGLTARPAAPTTAAWSPDEAEYEDLPVSQMRKTIARRLTESIGPVPHFFLTVDVDMARAMEARVRMNALLESRGEKVSVNDLVIKATAMALRAHPDCNAQWHGDRIRRFSAVHVAVAVAVEDGLITPVVRNAHLKGVAQIGREVRELAARGREKKLLPEEYSGSTFSISNLGMFGIHEFTAIINPPEAGILAVGGVTDTPVAVDGQVVVRPRMRITMSCDHRVIDGAQGSRFLATLKTMLEEPGAMLV